MNNTFNLDMLACPSNSRQGGQTTSKLVQAFSYMDFNPNSKMLYVTQHIDFIWHYAPKILELMNFKIKEDYVLNKGKLEIQFINGSFLKFSRSEEVRFRPNKTEID